MKPAIRNKTNIIIDTAMFVVMIFLAIIGIVIRYTLIPGSERWEKYGQNVELSVWGMDRHDWGRIHLIVGIVLTGLLVFHIAFHWSQIKNMIKKLLPNFIFRSAFVSTLLLVSLLLLVSPFILSPKIGEPIAGQGQGFRRNIELTRHSNRLEPMVYDHQNKEENSSHNTTKIISQPTSEKLETAAVVNEQKITEEVHKGENRTLEIRGFHTLSEIAGEYKVPVTELKKLLAVPSFVSNNERLGKIRRTYGFTMTDVEDAIHKLQKS